MDTAAAGALKGVGATGSAIKVCAVVVTYNRADLLVECLDRLQTQSRPPDRILVVDNASSDGTDLLLSERTGIDVLRLPVNSGGAGGFEHGLREARRGGHDWYLLMDDDTFLADSCIEELLAGAARAPSRPAMMASVVRWKDGRLHPMNHPRFNMRHRAAFALGADAALLALRTTTFVAAMVHREALDRYGFPPGHYFIWSDDAQFTGRILRHEPGYLVPGSVAYHWTERPHTVVGGGPRFFYRVRNELWLMRSDAFGGLERLQRATRFGKEVVTFLHGSPKKREAVSVVMRGLRAGMCREPV